jgi:hypothetical protein
MYQQLSCLHRAAGLLILSRKMISPPAVLKNPGIILKQFPLPWDPDKFFVINTGYCLPGISMPGIFINYFIHF